jgi:hypothetical protein
MSKSIFLSQQGLTRIRIRMDLHWFGSPDPDLDPYSDKKLDPDPQ